MRLPALALCALLAGCTPGAPPAGTGGGGRATSSATINVSLSTSVVTTTAYGTSGGFSPAVTTVPVGANVQFVNVDSFAHTSTSLPGTSFPAASPFAASAQLTSGATLSGGWSSGALGAANASQVLLADKPGTYLYGCFFHYTAPMRGAIVVR